MSQSSVTCSNRLISRGLLRHLPLALCFAVAGLSAQPLLAATATTTALTVSPTALAPGKPAKLVATVTDTSNNAVFPGTVTFYDGTRLLGSAQIVSHPGGSFAPGTATLNIASFEPGTNSITAVFAGTRSFLSSTSPAKTLTVTGPSLTATSLAVSGTSGDYGLIGSLQAFGNALPSGSIDFLNTATGASLGSLSVSSANPARGFVTSSTLNAPAGSNFPTGLAVGDLNGDGLLDMAISYSTQSAGVYLGKGDGTFAAPTYYPNKNNPTMYENMLNVYFGDLNNDGILDLIGIYSVIVNNNLSAYPVLFLGNGDGTFKVGVPVGIDQTGAGCVGDVEHGAIADFDRDGNLDFVMTGQRDRSPGYNHEAICVVRGNGDGTFQTPQTNTSTYISQPYNDIVVGDLNGDNIPDLVETVHSSVSGSYGKIQQQVWIGNGDGTFKAPTLYSLGGDPGPATVDYATRTPITALGDLNGDGKLDLVVSNYLASTVYVSFGKGDGSFETPVAFPVQFPPGQPVIVDINRDGKPDIVVADYEVNVSPGQTFSIPIFLGSGDGTFQPVVNYPVGSETAAYLVTGDFNGDGLPDLLTDHDYTYQSNLLLNGNTASVTLSNVDLMGPGTNSVAARYTGDSNYSPSTSCVESPGVTPQSPKLNGIYSDHITSTSASIGWTSNFPTNGYVSYGTTSALGQGSPFEQNATGFHFVTLAGLTPGATYYYSVTSIGYFSGCDHWTTASSINSFTTPAQ